MGTTKPASERDEVGRLQQQLSEAIKGGDKDGEIGALLAIGETSVVDAPDLAFSHFRLAEKVIRGSKQPDRLHEAIGGQGRALRRQKRFAEAIERYMSAEKIAEDAGNESAQIRWMLRRASALRDTDQAGEAKALIERADTLLHPPLEEKTSLFHFMGKVNFSDKRQVAVLAELEGQIGLTLKNEGDEQGADDRYRSALFFAEMAEDWNAVNTWGTNVGNCCVRRGEYTEAIECYQKALDASMRHGNGSGVPNTAVRLARCFAGAYRHEEGGDRLRALADGVSEVRLKTVLLDQALMLFDGGLCAKKAIATAKEIEQLVALQNVRPEFTARVKGVRENMERLLSLPPKQNDDAPPPLDLFLSRNMVRAEESGHFEPALQAAHLVCDIRLALALAGEKQWNRLVGGDMLQNAGLDLRVISDTLRMLLEANQTDQAIELLQRFKAPSFCVPMLLRLQTSDSVCKEADAYLEAVREISEAVKQMASPAKPDYIRSVNAIRRAGERMREAGEALREVDPTLLARLGGSVRRHELIDALPYAGGVGIVDFFVGRNATAGVTLARGNSGVYAIPFISPSFNATHVLQLTELYGKGNLPKQLGGAQTEALMQIAKILHDNFFCGLARSLSQQGINQLILIPDSLTRNLPLHLSLACGKEFNISGVDTSDADFLCEVMPVEYSSCLQAVAASQVHLRPLNIEHISAFADPRGDLPAVRASMEEFGGRVANQELFSLASGPAATKAAVSEALQNADVLIFGTHGVFLPDDLEGTHLVLSGEPWTMGDMMRMPEVQKHALFVLVACEAGAVAATPDERNAWGIPGALVCAGASAVLANLWPVENITSNILLERFLVHLGHRGYRPSAALFRAVRDLRRMGRDEALALWRGHLDMLKKQKVAPSVLVGLRSILEWIEDNNQPQPFAHPFFWGATAIFGSGWHLPAGAVVGPPQVTIENHLRLAEADDLVRQWQPRRALELAKQVADSSDGAPRAHAYIIMALAMLRSTDLSSQRRVRQKAERLLKMAERIAVSEESDELRKRVEWAKTQLEDDDVVQKHN